MTIKVEVALCLPRDAATVGLTRGVVAAALRELGVVDECIDEIRLALSEACTNVVEHSDATDEYEVQLEVEDGHCEIRVIDAGRGWDADDLQVAMPSPEEARGRGLALMRAVMDSTSFESRPEAGAVVRLVKRLELDPSSPLRGSG